MPGLLRSLVAGFALAATIATGALASETVQGDACTSYSYSGTYCSSLISYQTSINTTAQATVETILASTFTNLTIVKALNSNCYQALAGLACGVGYPQCNNSAVTYPCQSACESAVSVCSATFSGLGMTATLQAAVSNCTQLSSINTAAYPTTACFTPAAIAAAVANSSSTSNSSSTTTTTTCPYFFVAATSNASASSNNCASNGCCVPCPVQEYFYPVGSFSLAVRVEVILHLVSAILMAYVVLSWSILPGRRAHPGDIVLHFSVAIMIWMFTPLFMISNPRMVQCADTVTTATASNNTYCGAMGGILMLFIHATVFWAGYMIMNLHATIVWRSSVFERYKPLGVVFCWGLPGVFTFLPFLISKVDASTGMNCLVTPSQANLLFFLIDGIVVVPSFFVNVATMVHIMIMTRRSSSNSQTHSSNAYSSNGAAKYGENAAPKPLSARRQVLILLKLNWRAMMLGLVFVLTYVVYFIFFQVVVTPTAGTTSTTDWVVQWTKCVVGTTLTGNDAIQNDCAAKFASFLPSFGLLVFANVISSSVGLWTFFIFGFNMQLIYDWMSFLSTCGRGSRARQPEYEMYETEWR